MSVGIFESYQMSVLNIDWEDYHLQHIQNSTLLKYLKLIGFATFNSICDNFGITIGVSAIDINQT